MIHYPLIIERKTSKRKKSYINYIVNFLGDDVVYLNISNSKKV